MGMGWGGEETGQQKIGLRGAKYFRTWNWLGKVAGRERDAQRDREEGRENLVLIHTQTSAGSSISKDMTCPLLVFVHV